MSDKDSKGELKPTVLRDYASEFPLSLAIKIGVLVQMECGGSVSSYVVEKIEALLKKDFPHPITPKEEWISGYAVLSTDGKINLSTIRASRERVVKNLELATISGNPNGREIVFVNVLIPPTKATQT